MLPRMPGHQTQSPVERSLGILAKFQAKEELGGEGESDIAFLRSMLYALQQNGIDDTNFIPSYLLEEEEEVVSPTSAETNKDIFPFLRMQSFGTERAVKSWLLSTYCRNRDASQTEDSNSSSFSSSSSSSSSSSFSSSSSSSSSSLMTSSSPPSASSSSFSSSPSSSSSLSSSPSSSSPLSSSPSSSSSFSGSSTTTSPSSGSSSLLATSSPSTRRSRASSSASCYPPSDKKIKTQDTRNINHTYVTKERCTTSRYYDTEDVVVTEECAKALSQRHDYKFNIIEAKRTSPKFGFLLVSAIFEDWNLFEKFKIQRVVLRRFVQKVSLGYHPNPYHNFTHAVDVFQTLHCLLRGVGKKVFDDCEVLAMLVAALVHDLGHDGFSNAFHVMTFSERALNHNDISPQENHHLKQGFTIMQNEDFDIFAGLEASEAQRVREFMIHVVLHTDMSGHFEMETQVKTFLKNKGVESFGENKDAKKLLGSALLHAADISNPSKSFSVARYWSCNINEEFFCQGAKEKELALPISPMCDKSQADTVPAGQIGFINFIVLPYYTVMAQIVPLLMEGPILTLQENVRLWGLLEGKGVQELVALGVLPSSFGGGKKGGEREKVERMLVKMVEKKEKREKKKEEEREEKEKEEERKEGKEKEEREKKEKEGKKEEKKEKKKEKDEKKNEEKKKRKSRK